MLAEHGGRSVRIRPLPIGVPFSRFETMAKKAPSGSVAKKIKVGIKGFLSPARFDYTLATGDSRCGSVGLHEGFAQPTLGL